MNMQDQGANIREEARRWVIATRDPSFDGWDRMADWLEQDAAHLSAYEEALDLDAWAGDALTTIPFAAHERGHAGDHADTDNVVVFTPPARSRRWFLGAGMAAVIVAALGAWAVVERMDSNTIMTQPGERRTLQLADGSSVILNGETTLRLDETNPRLVELAQGEALFEVRHDDSDPFVVMAGTTRLVDAGTIFNVQSEDGLVDVAVAHGAVIYEPGAREIRLDAGDALHRSAKDAQPVLRKANTETVGSWQSGVLQYDNIALDVVARDLERNTGLQVRPEAGIEKLRFTGTLTVAGTPQQVFARIGPLLGVRFAPDGSAWKMIPTNGSRP